MWAFFGGASIVPSVLTQLRLLIQIWKSNDGVELSLMPLRPVTMEARSWCAEISLLHLQCLWARADGRVFENDVA
jgi:hypothetical protein